ncbi:hypothetical protein ACFYVL_43890 [Streptomyces sp. NPDC004111]|uniref:hypothetical protein n=1 Tax=Streptomyces sp. NPDC004111 TaxID=3364690 RepID=UPI00368DCCF5
MLNKNKNNKQGKPLPLSWSPRAFVLAGLGALTLGVAVLSVAVSYSILSPHFGPLAAPTVAALDVLWVVLQATEILAGNHRTRAGRVRWAGLALTAVIAAVPTADLILTANQGLDLAVVLTPVAIVSTKAVWWLVLPSLGRRVSPSTRQAIDSRRQTVADRLEQMEADAADRIELLRVAGALQRRVSAAETGYRRDTLKAQERAAARLHGQAASTADTFANKPLPDLVATIALPELDGWEPETLALPVTPVTPAVSQVSGAIGSGDDESSRRVQLAVTVAEIAAVTGVPTPETGVPLTSGQIGVVLRALRYSEDPPMSYRQASAEFRRAGYLGGEDRVRPLWRDIKEQEAKDADQAAEDADEDADEDAEAHR